MANDLEKRITAKMVLDSTGFNNSIKGVNAELKVSQSELKNASTQVGVFGKDSERLKGVQEALAKQVELHAKKVDIYKESLAKATEKMEGNINKRDDLKKSLDNANKSYEEAVKTHGKESEAAKSAKEEIEKLTKEHENAEKAVESNARQVQNYEANVNKANEQLTRTQGELGKVSEELEKSNNKWLTASETLSKSSEKLKEVGGSMQSAGDGLLKISAPFVGASIAASKFSTDFNASMANVGTLIPGQQQRLESLKGSVQDVAMAVGKGTDDIADGTYQVISAFGDADDTMKKVEINAKSAVAGIATTTDALNLSSAVMKGYGDTTAEANEKVMDMAFMTVKLGQTDFPSLAGSIGRVVPLSNELKISQEEMFAVFATGTGVTGGAAEVSTQYRGILQSLMAPTDSMTQLIKEMGYSDGKAMIEKEGLANTISLVVSKAKETNTPLQKYIGSIEGQTLALALAGEQNDVFVEKLEQMKASSGSMQEAFDQQTNGINKNGFAFQQSMIKMQVAGEKFGDAIAPLLGEFADLISTIAGKISQMDEEQLKTIANVGLFTVGLGGVLKVGGGAVSAVGSIAGGLSKLTGILGTATTATATIGTTAGVAGGVGGMAGLGTAIGGAALAAAPFVAAGAAVVGTGILIHKTMSKDCIPTVDLFADKVEVTASTTTSAYGQMAGAVETNTVKISQATQDAVGAYIKMDEDVSKELLAIYANSTTITEQTVSGLVGKYNQMNADIKSGMEKRHLAQYEDMKTFFETSASLTAEEEKKALEKLNENNEVNKTKMDEHTKRIQEILETARKEKRELTLAEQKEINGIQEEMKVSAVKTLSATEIESKVILERLKQHSTRLTAEQASEIIKNANETKNKSISAAEEQYKKTLENIVKMRDESGVITADQAEKLIADAVKQKEESIKEAEAMKDGVVEKMKSMNADIIADIDTSDGHIKSRWEKLKDWFSNNPITRFFQNSAEETDDYEYSKMQPGRNWTGTNYWQGGLTYLHDAPGRSSQYELYDLPRGTRVYNHDASQDMVLKTAESVATKVAEGMLSKMGQGRGIEVTQNIYSPTPTPSETARQTKNALRELALNW